MIVLRVEKVLLHRIVSTSLGDYRKLRKRQLGCQCSPINNPFEARPAAYSFGQNGIYSILFETAKSHCIALSRRASAFDGS
jgi:hypothetical protein